MSANLNCMQKRKLSRHLPSFLSQRRRDQLPRDVKPKSSGSRRRQHDGAPPRLQRLSLPRKTAGISQILAKKETPLASGEANDAAAQRSRFVGMLIYERRDSRSPEKKQYRSGARSGRSSPKRWRPNNAAAAQSLCSQQ